MLQQRFVHSKDWRFGNPNAPYRGMEDHYILPWGECHPDFEARPIGHSSGAKVCVRKPYPETGCIRPPKLQYYRGSANLYTPTDTPTQNWNPYPYDQRRMLWEGQLVRDGYVDLPTKYNGTGIELTATPKELTPDGKPFYQFPYSFMPNEDPTTGLRVAYEQSQQVPPPKYDITRLQQPYNLWKQEQIRMQYDTSEFDRNNQRVIYS